MSDEAKSNMGLYLGALLILALLEVTFCLGINALRPDQDNTSLIVMVGAVLVPMVTSIINMIQGQKQHTTAKEVKSDLAEVQKATNGRVEQLIAAAAKAAHAEGYHAGKSEAILMLTTLPPADATVPQQVEVINSPKSPVPVTSKTE